jgi:polynucleotide 5'-kinase involved in rRNA processing
VAFGQKGCGKSTTNKALINRLLGTHSHVLYLESDLGQPEFTPPGMLSLSLLDAPQFGPAFSHLGCVHFYFYLYFILRVDAGILYLFLF